MCWNRVLCAVSLLASVFMNGACAVNEDDGVPCDGLRTMELKLAVQGSVGSSGTRSILPEESIESMITEVTLASYDGNGRLVTVLHYDSPDASMLLYVSGRTANNVYALVNMGDMTDAFPSVEAGVADIVYMLDSYEEVSRKGIPMCGVLKGCVYEKGKVRTLQLERLFAKLNVRILHTGLEGGQTEAAWAYNLANRSLYIRQANRRLCPFVQGGGRAETPSDVMEQSDCNPDLADGEAYKGSLLPAQMGPGLAYLKDTTVVLYVPENVQGVLLPGNEDPFAKVAENISGDGGGSRADLCTYLEYNASRPNRGEGYYGDLMYRCYIGEDNVSDFSIRRNCRYDLTMNFTEEGFMLDSWKVVRGENWTDTRTLYFVGGPFVVYPGTTTNVLVHYNRTSSSAETGSTGYSSEFIYEFDAEAMKKAGLTCTFMGEDKAVGNNGYSDYYFKITASADAKVGASLPITVRLKNGTRSDIATVCVSEIGGLAPVWDFCPRYVSQTGELTLGGAVESLLPISAVVSDASVLDCARTGENAFRFTALKAGTVDVTFSNSDASQTLKVSMAVSAPVLNVSEVNIALNPDGAKGRLDYCYVDAAGVPLTNVDESAYIRYLKPVVSGCGYIASDVSDSYMDIYIDRLYSAGKQLEVGSYYQISVAAADCAEVGCHTMRAYVVDPFENTGTVNVGALNDYTLLGMSSVPLKVRNCFSTYLSSKLNVKYEIPPVDADEAYVSSSFEPVWMDIFSYENGVYGVEYKHSDPASSKGASVRLFQNTVYSSTSHSAGLHELKLHVRNRYSGDCLSRTLATADVYVHAAIGARASFGYMECNAPYGGTNGEPTVAGVYNSIAGTTVYDKTSSARIYYMDVSVEYLTPADKVFMFERMMEDVVSGYNFFDGLDWVRPSRADGELDLNQRFLYSVCVGGDQRVAICGEPQGYRKGVGTLLYRALRMATASANLSDSQLKQMFLGYSSAQGSCSAMYAPAYEMHDMNISTDMSKNVVSKNRPYPFTPRSCSDMLDSDGNGYHVIHTLNMLVPASSGWINVL